MYVSIRLSGCLIQAWDGKSWDPVYCIPILFQLKIILQFCETGCSILSLTKSNRANQSEGRKKNLRNLLKHKYFVCIKVQNKYL